MEAVEAISLMTWENPETTADTNTDTGGTETDSVANEEVIGSNRRSSTANLVDGDNGITGSDSDTDTGRNRKAGSRQVGLFDIGGGGEERRGE